MSKRGRKAKDRHEIMAKIISERQPVKLYVVKAYAACYVQWRGVDKNDMYQYIKNNFNVDVDGMVRMQ